MSDLNHTVQEHNNEIEYSIPYILKQIAAIQQETGYLYATISNLAAMSDGDSGDSGSPGNFQGEAKAKAYGDIVRCRETTNQQMLRMYEKMYEDLSPNENRRQPAHGQEPWAGSPWGTAWQPPFRSERSGAEAPEGNQG